MHIVRLATKYNGQSECRVVLKKTILPTYKNKILPAYDAVVIRRGKTFDGIIIGRSELESQPWQQHQNFQRFFIDVNIYFLFFKGDSGGPLVVYNSNGVAIQVGVVSFVHIAGCGSGNPSGYVRTASYLRWIHEHTGLTISE